ncbi:hypothetical protein M569_14008 [Genlisea aurea]|uniref:PUM-HD domain-containing protein n=1 Tax=Genlisea aurea TaxID=192259 RepID=S8C8T7_9LAMI|nr:hypothetical protein M569_14008 [Genlisea aurea]
MERNRSPATEEEEEDGEYRSRLMYFERVLPPPTPTPPWLGNRGLALEEAFSRMSVYDDLESGVRTPPFHRASSRLDAPPPYVCDGLFPSDFWAHANGSEAFGRRGRYLDAAAGLRRPFGLAALSESGLPRRGLDSGDNGSNSFLRGTKPLSVTANEYRPDSSSGGRINGFLPRAGPSYLRESFNIGCLRGRIVQLAKHQPSSAGLISKLDRGVVGVEIDMILPEVLASLDELLVDQFGNRFVQSLFSICNEDQRTMILIALTQPPAKFFSICTNQYGCKAANQLLGKLLTPRQISLVVSSLTSNAVSFATHENGHRVLQLCIKSFPEEYNTGVINVIASKCFEIAMDRSGCVVLQDCMEHSSGITREFLIRQILADVLPLAEDRFGNYVVQRLLQLKLHDAIAGAFGRLSGSFVYLSRNKFGSNVVEKLINETSETTPLYTEIIIRELVCAPDAPSLLIDPFGNYVVQTALSASKGHAQKALIRFIESNSGSMQSSMYGKKILGSLEKVKLKSEF